MPKRPKSRLIKYIVLAAALIVAVGVFSPLIAGYIERLPEYKYYKLTVLADTIEERGIFWAEGDDPLAIVYCAYFEEETPSPGREIKNALTGLIREDPENYYVLANLMLSHYDKYSKLVTPLRYEELYPENENYKGLGITVSEFGPFVRVADVYENSAADKAGILPGDLIAQADGEDLRALDYSEAYAKINALSKEGGTLGIFREGEDSILTVTAVPGEVVIPNVSWRTDGDIAYLDVTLFEGDDFENLINSAFRDFESAGAENLILDLRDNRGGSIKLLTILLDALTPDTGIEMFTEEKRGGVTQHFSKGTGFAFSDAVVLVNASTCSSAEVCAGYMKDRGYAVCGTLTYGKGTGLSIMDFYGDTLVIATINITLPVTGSYDGTGIYPTQEVGLEILYADLPEFTELPAEGVGGESEPESIYALEEALYALGYIFTVPDGVWDDETAAAAEHLNALADGTTEEKLSPSAVLLVGSMTARLSGARYIEDTQLLTAYEYFGLAALPAA